MHAPPVSARPEPALSFIDGRRPLATALGVSVDVVVVVISPQ